MTGSARDLATYAADKGFGRRLIGETSDGKVVLVASQRRRCDLERAQPSVASDRWSRPLSPIDGATSTRPSALIGSTKSSTSTRLTFSRTPRPRTPFCIAAVLSDPGALDAEHAEALFDELHRHIAIEEYDLFPAAAQVLTKDQ